MKVETACVHYNSTQPVLHSAQIEESYPLIHRSIVSSGLNLGTAAAYPKLVGSMEALDWNYECSMKKSN
eukprot:COSAG02_NODE_38974_length_422_cov_1.188854_1_plen_68_part_10